MINIGHKNNGSPPASLPEYEYHLLFHYGNLSRIRRSLLFDLPIERMASMISFHWRMIGEAEAENAHVLFRQVCFVRLQNIAVTD